MKYKPVYIKQIDKTVASPLDEDYLVKLKSLRYLLYKIPYYQMYRPDLISFQFYGDVKYAEDISLYNDFKYSPEDYTVNKIIRIPDPQGVKTL